MLDENNNIKIYEFDFGNPFKKFISYFIFIIAYLTLISYILIGSMVCLMALKNSFENQIFLRVLSYIFLVLIVASVVLLFVLVFKQKRIILYDTGIYIKRNFFPSIDHINRGFNDYIMYYDIEYCELDDTYQKPINHMFYKLMDPPFMAFNNYSLVEIIDKDDKCYYIPVKNAEDFVREVNERVDIAIQKKNSNIKEQ